MYQRPFQRSGLPQYYTQHHRSQLLGVILSRSRVTNLGLIVLSVFTAVSVIINFRLYFAARRPVPVTATSDGYDTVGIPHRYRYSNSLPNAQTTTTITHEGPLQPSGCDHNNTGILATIERDEALRALDHLVVVPGHAVWRGTRAEGKMDPGEWVMEAYQLEGGSSGKGRVAAFVEHINRGAEIARNDERAVLIFSGGQTHRMSTTTEAESYMRLALLSDLLQTEKFVSEPPRKVEHPGPPPSNYPLRLPLFNRTTTENHALDSFQNLLFSIARFHEYTGRYPAHITVVGYNMKRRRFSDLHRSAIRWPDASFDYVGIDPKRDELTVAQQGEYTNGYQPYLLDTYGCHPPLLTKRRARNPSIRFHSYYTSAPELRALLDWCPEPGNEGTGGGMTKVFSGPLPWDDER